MNNYEWPLFPTDKTMTSPVDHYETLVDIIESVDHKPQSILVGSDTAYILACSRRYAHNPRTVAGIRIVEDKSLGKDDLDVLFIDENDRCYGRVSVKR